MVYTSRDRYFVRSAENVINFHVKKADGILARNMLLRHANFSDRYKNTLYGETASAFNGILEVCQGLPLALGIVGGSILKMWYEYDVDKRSNVWVDYRAKLENFPTIYDLEGETYGEIHCPRIVDLSLDVLHRRTEIGDVSSFFRALCVLQKKQTVSVSVLQKIWNLDNLEKVQKIISAFFRCL